MKEINLEEEKKERKARRGSAKNADSKKEEKAKAKEAKVKAKEEKEKEKKQIKEAKEAKKKEKKNTTKTKEEVVVNFADELSIDEPQKEEKTKKEKPVKEKKKISKLAIFFVILYLLLCGAVVYGGYFLGNKYALINVTKLNKQELGVNEHAFDEVDTNLTREEFNKIKTIAVFGTDNRTQDIETEGARSDVNMVVSINPTTKSIKMISVPRDTYVQIKGSKDKMGHAYFYGGPTLAINTLNQNFGLNITDYATIDFVGVINAINKLGGVEIDITEKEMNYINEWTKESYCFSGRPYETLTKFGPKTLLNGEQALAHARNRTIGNDFVRAERQRTVLTAIINKLSTKNLSEIMSLVDTMLKEVETNANVSEYLSIVPSMLAHKDEYLANIISAQVPDMTNLKTEMINGISCVVPISMTRARQSFQDYLFNK